VLRDAWENRSTKEREHADLLQALLAQNAARREAWQRRKHEDIESFRYEMREEYATRLEAMGVALERLEVVLARLASELETKHAAERRWFNLVMEERGGFLAEIYWVERKNGGDDDDAAAAI